MIVLGILKKEMKAFFRDTRTFGILLISAVLLTVLIGYTFLGNEVKDVPVILCGNEKNELYNNISILLKESEIFKLEEIIDSTEGCETAIKNNIENARSKAGIIIPSEASNNTLELQIIVDNSRAIGEYVNSYLKFMLKDVSQSTIIRKSEELGEDIEYLKTQLEDAEDKLSKSKKTVEDVENDITSLENNFSDSKISYEDTKRELRNAVESLNDVVISFSSIKNVISSINLVSDNTILSINSMNISQIDKSILIEQINGIKAASNNLSEKTSALEENLILEIENLNSTLEQNSVPFNKSLDSLREIKLTIHDLEKNINFNPSNISQTEENFDSIETKSYEFFERRKIDFIFPTIMIVILIMITSYISSVTLTRQRNSGLISRIIISPKGYNFLFIQKLFILTLISLITVPVIIVTGILVFSITIGISNYFFMILDLLFIIIIFLCLGLIIASSSKNETTSVILSLLMTLPLLFMSGIAVPLEKFPDILRIISEFLPLTLSVKVLEGLTLYNNPTFIETSLIYLFIYTVLILIIAYIFVKRNIKQY